MLNSVEQVLVWLGHEDYTGLWQVVLEVREAPDVHSLPEAQAFARQIIESLLSRGFIELFRTEGAWDNDSFIPVPAEHRLEVLDNDASWSAEGDGTTLVWFGTTDEGLAAHQKSAGWP